MGVSKKGLSANHWSPSAIELLKRRVASLLARRLDVHEIVQMLSTPTMPGEQDIFGQQTMVPNPSYFINPRTGRPYGKSTIYRIKDEIYADWRRKDSEKIDQMFAEVIGSLEEIVRRAFGMGDYELALGALDRIINIIGANKPVRVDLTFLREIDWESMPSEELERIAGGDVSGLLPG